MTEADFKKLLLIAHQYCLPRLNRLTQSQADSEDVFMEAAYQFWNDLQAGKIKDQRNLKALIFVMAKNLYLSQLRKRNRKSLKEYNTDPQMMHLHENKLDDDLSDAAFNLMIKKEEETKKLLENKQRNQAFDRAMKALEEKCQELLMQFIVHKTRLKTLQQKLGFASPDAVKTAKYRCKKKLVDLFQGELERVTL